MLIEGYGIPNGIFVVRLDEVDGMEFVPVGSDDIHLDIATGTKGRVRIYQSDSMFAVVVTVRKGGELYQQWVEPAGIVGRTGISEVRVPMPKGERHKDGREYIRLSDLVAFLGSDARRCLTSTLHGRRQLYWQDDSGLSDGTPGLLLDNCSLKDVLDGHTYESNHLWIRAADAKDACILAFVGDGTQK